MDENRFSRENIDDIVDELDAAIFSGDTFLNLSDNGLMLFYLQRWERQLLTQKRLSEIMDKQDD